MQSNIDVAHLDIHSAIYDLRRDLFKFMQYCQEYEIKRSVSGNMILKSDYKRITKFIGRPKLMEDYDKYEGLWWIDFLDKTAFGLGWISYDTEGVYRGYTSQQASFVDNYIEVDEKALYHFLQMSALEQELYLYRYFKNNTVQNVLMNRSLYGRLDYFSSWGSATGVLPTLDLSQSRTFFLGVLADLEPNQWYATADLIAKVKVINPWFLIPKEVYIEESGGWRKPKKKVKYDRYYNFMEGDRYGGGRLQENHIKDDDPKGFEKVEGRYIERTLEGFLLTLGYTEVAYSKEPYKGKSPAMGTLEAFRLSPLFFSVINKEALPIKVSIQPNFEIYVDSPCYPMAVLQALLPFTSVVKEDVQIILKLEKQYVLSHLVEHPEFDLLSFLTKLSNTPVPQNLVMEIKEWTSRTDVFTLYEGYGLY